MRRRIVTAAVLSAAAFSAAQNEPATEAVSPLPEMVVTADRSPQPMHATAANVSVLTAADLRKGHYLSVADALRSVPGIHLRSISGNPATGEISMRGFGENSHGRILVLLDGRRLNRPDQATINWFQIPINSVERIEVVRGSSTALYGDNALAGVIHIITRSGTDEPATRINADAGSFGTASAGASTAGKQGDLGYAANAESYQTDGYRDRSGVDSLGAGVHFDYALSETVDTSFGLSWQRVDYEIPGYLTLDAFRADPEQSLYPADSADNDYMNADAGIGARIADGQRIEMDISYGRKDIESSVESWSIFTDLVLDTLALTPRYSIDSLLGGHANSLLVGLDYYVDAMELDRFTTRRRDDRAGVADIRKSTIGVYARDEFAWRPDLLMAVAGRLETADVDAEVSDLGSETVDDDTSHDGSAVDASLLRTFENRSKIFARIGTTYRYPFVDEQVSYYGWGDAFYGDLDPETGWNSELGGTVRPCEALSAGVTVFLAEMKDEIAYNPVALRNENLDRTRRRGVETECTLRGGFYVLSADYSYIEAEFTEGAHDGRSVPLVPEHKASASADIELPRDFSVRGVATYTGTSYLGGDNANEGPKLDDYVVVDVFLRYAPSSLEGFEAYVGVENLFDEEYASLGFRGFTDDGYYPSPGMAYRAGASYRF